MTKRPRTERRQAERALRKEVAGRQQAALALPGGSRQRPVDVETPAVIRGRAESTACPLCGGRLSLEDEGAEFVDGQQLRSVALRCRQCGVPRTLWYRLSPRLPS